MTNTPIDNKNGRPLEHYRALFAAEQTEDMTRRTGIPFSDGAFHTTLLGKVVSISHPGMEAAAEQDGSALSPATQILLGRYLLEGAALPCSGKFLSYAEFPWGSVYNAQFTGRCIRRLAAVYGSSLARFSEACEALGGRKISGADGAYELELLPGLLVRLLLWEGDEEFPPSAQFLFSDNFAAAFTAEDMAVAGDVVLNAMKGKW